MLRPFTSADGADVERLAGAWEIADTTLNIPHPYPEGGGEKWIKTHAEAWARGTGLTLAIALRAAPTALIGAIGLDIAPEHARGELGYRSRPYREGIAEAIGWFTQAGYLRR